MVAVGTMELGHRVALFAKCNSSRELGYRTMVGGEVAARIGVAWDTPFGFAVLP